MSNKKILVPQEEKERIVQRIGYIKDGQVYKKIFKMLTKGDNKIYTKNSNGVFLNLSSVPDDRLLEVKDFLDKHSKAKQKDVKENLEYVPYIASEAVATEGPKLTNYEKNILKQKKIKNMIDGGEEMEKMDVNTITSDGTSTDTDKAARSKSKSKSAISKSSKSSKSTKKAEPASEEIDTEPESEEEKVESPKIKPTRPNSKKKNEKTDSKPVVASKPTKKSKSKNLT